MQRSPPIRGEKFTRHAQFDRKSANAEARTVALSFSSEAPVDRGGYREILVHDPTSMKLDRLRAGGPVLVDHDRRDQVGVVERVEIGADRRGRAVVRFGKGARASEVFQDVIDGIRRNVSFGYWIHDYTERRAPDGVLEVVATSFEPFEISITSVAADTSVGVGRAAVTERNLTMETEEIEREAQSRSQRIAERRSADVERDRVRGLLDAGNHFARWGGAELAIEYVREGRTMEEFQRVIMERVRATKLPSAEIGLTQREVQQFSLVRAIRALAWGKENRRLLDEAAFEFEASRAAVDKLGREPRGFTLPQDVIAFEGRRDLLVGTPTAGGHTVATDLLASQMIGLLSIRPIVVEAGATMLSGLQGNVAIPRQTARVSVGWVAENVAVAESQPAFDQVTMTPKTVGAFTDVSRKLLLQSSIGIEAFVRRDLGTAIATEIDRAAINGSGSGSEPRGVLQTAGIGSVAGGTNGAAPTWANIIALESAVATSNADVGALGYVTNSKVRGKLKGTEKASSTGIYVWDGSDRPLNGYRGFVSQNVPSNLTKGTSNGICSAIAFGNWADLIVGMWSGIDINVDTATFSTTGAVRVVALQDVDVAVRHAESFAAMLDALTT